MAKKTTQKKQEISQAPAAANAASRLDVVFPEISLKEDLECTTILEDQILVIDVWDKLSWLQSNTNLLWTGFIFSFGMQSFC